MTAREYTNPFEHVHKKGKVLRDHMRDLKQKDAELRETPSSPGNGRLRLSC
jgi:hypothetical protein